MLGYLYVAVGSALGGVARWKLGEWLQQRAGGVPPAVFPVGTLIVNVSGSFVLGVLAVTLARPGDSQADAARLLLAVGLCGGYTTFSTFSVDTVALLEQRGWSAAMLNVLASLALGVVGAVGGMTLGRVIGR